MDFVDNQPAYSVEPSQGSVTVNGSATMVTLAFTFEGSELSIQSGDGIFSSISPADKAISVAAGQAISGHVHIRENNRWPFWTPLIATPSWGNHITAFSVVAAPVPNGTSTQDAEVNLIAPSALGLYYLIFASSDDSPNGTASSTASYVSPVWNDGNDKASINSSQIAQAQGNGYIVDSVLNNGTSYSYFPAFVAADVIEISVGRGYPLTFVEGGLPDGSPWWVTLNGETRLSTTNATSFSQVNGTYQFQVSSVIGYAAAPASGIVRVNGGQTSLSVSFRPNGTIRLAPPIRGWLHTNGTLILNGQGQPVRLLGLNVATMIAGSGYPVVNDTCQATWMGAYLIVEKGYNNMSEWGFNFVRLGMTWANLEPTPPTLNQNGTWTHHWNMAYVTSLDDIVRNLTSRGIAVILAMHQGYMSPAFKRPYAGPYCEGGGMPLWLYPDAGYLEHKFGQDWRVLGYAMCAFLADIPEPGVPIKPQDGFVVAWDFLTSRYANNSLVVGADILNEIYYAPFQQCSQLTGTNGDFSLRDFYLNVGNAIRMVNHNLLLVWEGGPSDPTPETNLDGPFPSNTVYSFHFYPSSWNQSLYDYQLSFARNWSIPTWMGEFNFRAADGGPDPAWRGDTEQLMAAAERTGLSWSFWSFDGTPGTAISYHGNGTADNAIHSDLETLQLLQEGLTLGYYNITIMETGLLPRTPWRVNLTGWTKSASGDAIMFPVLNGTYHYLIESKGYTLSSGTLVVDGSDLILAVQFGAVSTSTTTSISSSSSSSATMTTQTAFSTLSLTLHTSTQHGAYSYLFEVSPLLIIAGIVTMVIITVLSMAFKRKQHSKVGHSW